MASRLVELAIAATARLTTALGDEAVVSRCYVPEVNIESLVAGERFVKLWAPGYTDEGMATRGEKQGGYSLEIAIYEKFVGQEEPPLEWMDERVAWVKGRIVDLLGDPRVRLATSAYAETLTVTAYSDELYIQNVFWSNVLIVFRDTE